MYLHHNGAQCGELRIVRCVGEMCNVHGVRNVINLNFKIQLPATFPAIVFGHSLNINN